MGYFLLPTGLSELPISLAPLQRHQAWEKPALPNVLQSCACRPVVIQKRTDVETGHRWHVVGPLIAFPESTEDLLGPVWAILRFTPNCQLSESRHLLGTAQITWGTGLTVPSGLLGSHYSNNCTAPGKLTPSHIKTKKLACLFLWIFILFSA